MKRPAAIARPRAGTVFLARCGLLLALGLTCAGWARSEGVIERARASGHLVIAHRESSVPFSYLDANGQPIGYAVDLCLHVAEAMRKKLSMPKLAVQFLLVTPQTRMDVIEQGRADMECGSTTNNAERRQRVAFTLPHYITGARILVRANSAIENVAHLAQRTVVSTKGTTPLQLLRQTNAQRLMDMRIVEVPDHLRGVEMVESGEADAFVMDDVLLYGLVAGRPKPNALKVVGKFLAVEPLAIMLPKNDDAFKKFVDAQMRDLMTHREIEAIYERWFMQAIPPKQTALNLPPNQLLKEFWKYPSDYVPF